MARRKLSNISTSVLQQELQRRQSSLNSLVSKRSKLAAELALLDNEIGVLGGDAAGLAAAAGPGKRRGRPRKASGAMVAPAVRRGPKPGGKRPRNTMTLQDAIEKVLKGGTVLSVTEITSAVKKIGYKTNAENFRTIVNQTLIKNGKLFKKVARGQYTVK